MESVQESSDVVLVENMAETRGSVSPVNPCVISEKNSDLRLSEESNESTSMASVDDAAISSAAVTEEMFEIERQLEEEGNAEEEKFDHEALEQAKEKERKENCYKRLQHLLGRSSIYAQFLIHQMGKQESAAEKAEQKKQKSQSAENSKGKQQASNQKQSPNASGTGNSRSDGKKRAMNSSSKSSKRVKQEEVQLSEIFNKETVNAQASNGNKSADDSENSAVLPDTYSRTINGERISDRQPNLFTGGVMRGYQIEALEWLKVLYENGVNGILGDEMGLGKTIECIALIAHLVEMGVTGPYLVVCPLSTLINWVKEFKRFAPEIPVILYHGMPDERAVLRKKIYRKVLVRNMPVYPVIVTSYNIVIRDKRYLKNYHWVIIVDEAHRLKNWKCFLLRDLKMYRSSNRLLLTGTPLQNNLAELWSLLNFLLPEIFDDLQVFESWFDVTAMAQQSNNDEIIAQEQEKQIISTIHQILTPFLLRRTKADVDLKLPPKKELIVYAPLTPKQRELYAAVVNKNIREYFAEEEISEDPVERYRKKTDYGIFFDKSKDVEKYMENLNDHNTKIRTSEYPKNNVNTNSKSFEHPSIVKLTANAMLMMVRKVCNHPYLIEFPLDPRTQDYLIDEAMVNVCGKLQVLDLMLPELRKRGHKVLIFSQFVTMLDILDFYCEMRGYPFHRIHGAIPVEERQISIDDFNENPSSFLFLISTRAGGLGINLTGADTVIIYDSDWNPQNDLQAQDRCHRIGQTKPVVVYRLVAANTAEHKIVERACAKRKLEKMIMCKGRFSSSELMKQNKVITPDELLEILHETDYSAVMNMEDVISPENLNALLDRSDMLQASENSSLPDEQKKSNPTEVKGVFEVVEQVDSCDFSRI